MEVETHVHVHILNQLGFHELQLHAITWVENGPPPHVFMRHCVNISVRKHMLHHYIIFMKIDGRLSWTQLTRVKVNKWLKFGRWFD